MTSALLLSLTVILNPPTRTYADVAPPPLPTIGGPTPFEYQSTNVQMLYERVELEVMETEESDTSHQIVVNASFVLRNQGAEVELMDVAFPLDSLRRCQSSSPVDDLAPYSDYVIPIETFRAYANGKLLDISVRKVPFPADQSCYQLDSSWASFPVTFPVDEDVLLKVEYELQMAYADTIQTVEYILQTGAGWFGTISRGEITVRFPYLLDDRTILSGTSPGYELQYNEISWNFSNLEPSPDDDLLISFVSPYLVKEIRSYRERVAANPHDTEAWSLLANRLYRIAADRGTYRVDNYRSDIFAVFNEATTANPDDIPLLQDYAEFLLRDCCYYLIRDLDDLQPMLDVYDRILSIDPHNEASWRQINFLDENVPGFEYSPPPTRTATQTLTPTMTPLFSPTLPPSRTPAPSSTTVPPPTSRTPTKVRTSTPTFTTVETISAPVEADESAPFPLAILISGVAILVLLIFWRARR